MKTRPCCPTRLWWYRTGPGEVSLTSAATAAISGAAAISPTAAHRTSRARLAAGSQRDFLNPSEKMNQLGRRFSTAILPVYSS